jgi:DGQHR domain-containing protein
MRRLMREELRLPALRLEQGPGKFLYSFAVDGKLVPRFAAVSRIRRAAGDQIEGYQRPEVLSHIAEIKLYLESDAPMIPNAVVIAFDSRVKFAPLPKQVSTSVVHGTLTIPTSRDDRSKAGFIVDGQQRLAAVRDARITGFPLFVTAFISDDIGQQTEQFILVNTTKPLPKGLIYELLPSTEGVLPRALHRRRFPSYLLDRLNRDHDSPFFGRIQTPTTPQGVVKDNSILRMLENSLSDGALYRFRDEDRSAGDSNAMLLMLKNFWFAVAQVFAPSWGMPPKKSRLMHGAGVVALGLLMDAIADRHRSLGIPSIGQFREDLMPLATLARWTDGYWDFGPGQQRKWNEVQNTTKDIALLSNFLLIKYKSLVWERSLPRIGVEETVTYGDQDL